MNGRTPPRRGHRIAFLVSAALIAPTALVTGHVGSSAATAADSPQSDTMLTAEPLPTWQTDGAVYAVETVGDVVYVGGNFSAVRPPGAAPGSQEVSRKNMAAFDAATGELLPFQHTFSSPEYPVPSSGPYDRTCSPGDDPDTYTCDTVYEIRVSRDGSQLFVGGDFQAVDGKTRSGLASFATGSGGLTRFHVNRVYGRVRALVPGPHRLYFGGSFHKVAGKKRKRLAAVSIRKGRLTRWRPRTDGTVLTMEMSPDDTRVIIGGDFDRVNGHRHRGLMGVNPRTGHNVRWVSHPLPGHAGRHRSYATDLAVDKRTLYVASNGEKTFDGRIAMNPRNGRIKWKDRCQGATWAVERAGSLLYSGSHAHDCATTPGGFPEVVSGVTDPADIHWHRFLAQTAHGRKTEIQHWFPTTNGGIVGSLGPRDMSYAASAGVLWAVGEFTTVNHEPQQGLTRFGLAGSDQAESAAPERPDSPSVVSIAPGEVRVSWEATFDADNADLTYTLYRGTNDVQTTTPIHTVTVSSDHDAHRPMMSFVDTGLEPGSVASYQVRATDPSGADSGKSWLVPVTVATEDDAYRQGVLADGASLFWTLDEHFERFVGTLVAAGGPARATSQGIGWRAPGAIATSPDSTSVEMDGEHSLIRGRERSAAPQEFTAELWFRGSDPGKLFGFGNRNTRTSKTVGRHVYVDTGGHLVFGVRSHGRRTLRSAQRYDDGAWHQVVASLGPRGMELYVDGGLVARDASVTSAKRYRGYWQLGGDSLEGWPQAPTPTGFAGRLDEFSVYPTQLSGAKVAGHYSVATG